MSFNIARFEHVNEMRRKASKQKKKNGIQPFLESRIHWAGIRNPVLGIRNPQGGIQNPRLSWIPLHGAKLSYKDPYIRSRQICWVHINPRKEWNIEWRWCELRKYKFKWRYDRRSGNCNLSNCKLTRKKIRDSNGIHVLKEIDCQRETPRKNDNLAEKSILKAK